METSLGVEKGYICIQHGLVLANLPEMPTFTLLIIRCSTTTLGSEVRDYIRLQCMLRVE